MVGERAVTENLSAGKPNQPSGGSSPRSPGGGGGTGSEVSKEAGREPGSIRTNDSRAKTGEVFSPKVRRGGPLYKERSLLQIRE